MDFASDASAIDDSYGTIHLGPGRVRSDSPPPQEHFGYNGPRSGHWTVKTATTGSGVDDGCSTVWQLPNARYDAPGAHGGLKPLAGNVVRRLAKATEDQRKAVAAVNANATHLHSADSEERVQARPQVPDKPAVPKGFFIPKTDLRGIRIAGKDGKNEVVKQPQIVPVYTKIKATVPPKQYDTAARQAEPSPPEQDAKAEKPVSVASHASQRSQRTIRIAGKNGEEAFTYLPLIRPTSKPASGAAAKPQEDEVPKGAPRATSNDKAIKAQRDANAAKAAKELRAEREQQAVIDEQAKQAKLSADVMMSGALPAPSKRISPAASKDASAEASVRSSAKESKKASVHSVSKSSTIPDSLASSKTSLAQSQQAMSKKSLSRSAQSARSAHSRRTDASRKDEVENRTSKPPSRSQWREIGSGILDAPSPKQRGQEWQGAREANTPIHSFRASPHPNNKKGKIPSDRSSSHHYSVTSSRNARDSNHSSRPPQETIFAGRGWISPHPLSVAPSEHQELPDPMIKVPSREGGTMTYEEWKTMRRQSRRNNFSRSSSDGEPYGGGSWGYRKVSVTKRTEGVREQWEHEGRSGVGSRRYQSPRVESVRSGSGTFEHNFDGARDEDGRVQ